MKTTYLVTLDIPDTDLSSIDGYAEQIQESLIADGIPVETVKPWSRQDMPETGGEIL